MAQRPWQPANPTYPGRMIIPRAPTKLEVNDVRSFAKRMRPNGWTERVIYECAIHNVIVEPNADYLPLGHEQRCDPNYDLGDVLIRVNGGEKFRASVLYAMDRTLGRAVEAASETTQNVNRALAFVMNEIEARKLRGEDVGISVLTDLVNMTHAVAKTVEEILKAQPAQKQARVPLLLAAQDTYVVEFTRYSPHDTRCPWIILSGMESRPAR